jgi:DNA-binding NarL/FixJ family response regulator
MIRLLIVEDHAALRTALGYLIDREDDMTVAAQAGSIAEAVERLFDIDVALVDLDLPDGDGVTLIPEIRSRNPESKVVILTGSKDHVDYGRAIERGAVGVLHKTVSLDQVLDTIRLASNDQSIHSHDEIIEFMRHIVTDRVRDLEAARIRASITPRELDLLHGLADGLSDLEMAQRFNISVRTVQSHMLHLMDKLDVKSRLQALVVAVRHGLVSISSDRQQ